MVSDRNITIHLCTCSDVKRKNYCYIYKSILRTSAICSSTIKSALQPLHKKRGFAFNWFIRSKRSINAPTFMYPIVMPGTWHYCILNQESASATIAGGRHPRLFRTPYSNELFPHPRIVPCPLSLPSLGYRADYERRRGEATSDSQVGSFPSGTDFGPIPISVGRDLLVRRCHANMHNSPYSHQSVFRAVWSRPNDPRLIWSAERTWKYRRRVSIVVCFEERVVVLSSTFHKLK